jgi:hypothetical protein
MSVVLGVCKFVLTSFPGMVPGSGATIRIAIKAIKTLRRDIPLLGSWGPAPIFIKQ